MHIPLHHDDDPAELDRRIGSERDAKQRDRYRVVQLALAGEMTATIMSKLDRSKNFVQRWCYAYRDHGLDAIAQKPRPGRPTELPRDQEQAFTQRLLNGPTEADGGVWTLRGKDAWHILEEEFGVQYSLEGVYGLLHRLGGTRSRNDDPIDAAVHALHFIPDKGAVSAIAHTETTAWQKVVKGLKKRCLTLPKVHDVAPGETDDDWNSTT